MKTSREEFEEWASKPVMDPKIGNVDLAWLAWQAARAGMVQKELLYEAFSEGFTAGCYADRLPHITRRGAFEESNAKKTMEAAQ